MKLNVLNEDIFTVAFFSDSVLRVGQPKVHQSRLSGLNGCSTFRYWVQQVHQHHSTLIPNQATIFGTLSSSLSVITTSISVRPRIADQIMPQQRHQRNITHTLNSQASHQRSVNTAGANKQLRRWRDSHAVGLLLARTSFGVTVRERVLPPKNVVDKLDARLKAVSRSERWRDDLLFETQIKSFVAGLTTLTSCSHYCFNLGV